jgi:hypothetical protein
MTGITGTLARPIELDRTAALCAAMSKSGVRISD